MSLSEINPDASLQIRSLYHTTNPVRDRYQAARFYVAVLGGEITHESDPERVKQGKARALQIGVQICPGIEIDLFEQDYGQPEWDQSHPHHAFEVTAETLNQWVAHLKKWRVPMHGPMTRAGTGGAQVYFNDPDGNHLELNCIRYPEHASLPSGPYDKRVLIHTEPWPAPELEAEATRLLEASLTRMRASGRKAVD